MPPRGKGGVAPLVDRRWVWLVAVESRHEGDGGGGQLVVVGSERAASQKMLLSA